MKKIFFFVQVLAILLFTGYIAHGQIVIKSGAAVTPDEMVEKIVGSGIEYFNVEYFGVDTACGIFSNGSSTNLGMEGGILLTTGLASNFAGPNYNFSASWDNGISIILPNWTELYDPCILKFDFIPEGDTLRLRYVLGSEEYNEVVGSSFIDIMKIGISGPNPNGENYNDRNIANIPGTVNTSVSINTINNGWAPPNIIPTGPCMNCQYYNDNTNGTSLEYDGMTFVLTAWVIVVPCEQYHVEFMIVEPADALYDSGIAVEENSFISPIASIDVTVALDPPGLTENMVEGHVDADVIFKLPNPEYAPVTICYEITGTATNGVDYEEIDNCITFEEGEDSVSFHVVPLQDGVIEGAETIMLIIENTFGCDVKYDSIELIIKDYWDMISQITPSTTLCNGQPVELWMNVLNGFPPYQYYWEPGGFTDDTITVSPSNTTNFTVTCLDIFNDTIADSVLVTVLPVCDLETFYFKSVLNPGLPYDVYGEVTEDSVFVLFPAGTNLAALIPSFTFDDEACTDSVGTVSDFTNPVVYEFVGPGGCSSQWIVIAEIETGMSDNVTDDIIVIPNPSEGRFYISSETPYEIRIMDLTGKIIFESSNEMTGKTEIDLKDQPKGMYFIWIKTSEMLMNRKVVIQ